MTHKANSVTLTSYSSPDRAIPHPLNLLNLLNSMNPHAKGVSNGAARIGGGERSEPITRMPIKPYDTESKSRNVLASPLGEEGHEVAKGWKVVR